MTAETSMRPGRVAWFKSAPTDLYLYRHTDSVNAADTIGGSYAAAGYTGAGTQFMGWSDHTGYWSGGVRDVMTPIEEETDQG